MTDEQRAALDAAKRKCSELMSTLFGVRNAFYIKGHIPPNGHGVWQYIPAAQSIVHQIEALIEKAEKSADV